MILRNQVEWALHCAVVLAGLPAGKRVSAKVLSEFHGIPKEYLSKALQAMASQGLISGTTGPNGGYGLSRDPSEITFLDVVEAIEGKEGHFLCREIRKNNPCRETERPLKSICGIARVMYDADEEWRKSLRKTTLKDILKKLPSQIAPDLAAKSAAWIAKRTGTGRKTGTCENTDRLIRTNYFYVETE